jgi:hypothetical protein
MIAKSRFCAGFLLFCAFSGLIFGLPETAPAQNADLIKQFDGQLKDVRRGFMVVTGADGVEYQVAFPDEATHLVLFAKANANFMRPGMFVRTRVMFSGQGVAQTSVKKLELISQLPPAAVGHQGNQYNPGVNPVDPSIRPPQPGEYFVVGQFRGFANGMVGIQAGKVPLQLPVDPNGTIEIHANELTLAQAGDKVYVEGFYAEAQPTMIKANIVRVTPDRVYGEAVEAKPRKRASKEKKAPAAAKSEDAKTEDAAAAGDADSEPKSK